MSRLAIADIGISIESAETDLVRPAGGAMARFVATDDATPPRDGVVVEVRSADEFGEPPAGATDFDSGGLWRVYRNGRDYEFRFSSPALGGVYKVATFDSAFARGAVALRSDLCGAIDPLEYPLDEILMIHLLGRGRGIELHACGIATPQGEGLLFVGHSGAGKSTMARLWRAAAGPGATIISDDRVIIRPGACGFDMYGTPWHGEEALAEAVRIPLRRVMLLAHGSANRLRRLAPAEAVARLYAASFLPMYDAACVSFSIELLEALASAVPCEAMQFVPDSSVIDYIYGVVT